MSQPAVYILASRRLGTLYIGATGNLVQRAWQHRTGHAGGFTSRHGVHRLVYFELHGEIAAALRREKQLKKWNRAWKIELIEKWNPAWRDLWSTILGEAGAPEIPAAFLEPAQVDGS